MKTSSYILAVLILFIFIPSIAQNIPRTEKDIPIFPEAIVDMEAQQQALEDYKEIHEGESILNLSVKVYTVSMAPDEVCKFYIKKLGAKEGFPEDNGDSKPGVNTMPWFEVDYFPTSLFEDQHEGNIKIHDGKWLKTALTKRQQWIPGEWLQSAYFEWEIILGNDQMANFSIEIIDADSFDTRAKKVTNKTLITIISKIQETE
jgi:hypothetical protein